MMGGEITEGGHLCQPHILAKKSFSPRIIPKTKGLTESLCLGISIGNSDSSTEALLGSKTDGIYLCTLRPNFR